MPAAPTRGPGPLDGITVLDFSRVLAGPHAGRMLADLGADVVKVEPPEGDMTRFAYPRRASIATYFTQQNCGKRNLSLDLKKPEALALLHAAGRPGRRRPRELPAGRDGPPRARAPTPCAPGTPASCTARSRGTATPGRGPDRRAYAPVVGAEAGVTWLQGQARHGEYANDPLSHGDVYAGLEAVIGHPRRALPPGAAPGRASGSSSRWPRRS